MNLIATTKPRITRSNEHRIKRTLFRNYDKTTRPVVEDKAAVEVDVAISLYHILDTVHLNVSPNKLHNIELKRDLFYHILDTVRRLA